MHTACAMVWFLKFRSLCCSPLSRIHVKMVSSASLVLKPLFANDILKLCIKF
ncbi:hypothetical protein ES319_A03G060700v1 [Gossypium barbadense]|uniref:Uncharacterized protein n=1 Tax=Gossypium barbadense TaxID=3634 RepID=A0A5J5WBD2_GOSBA|nr:hypothetical protein ES319_A03G060700v1 [Gossypium barbadense]